MPRPMHGSQYAIRGGSSSSNRPTPGATSSSEKTGACGRRRRSPAPSWVSRPRAPAPEVDLRGGVEVQPPQRGREDHRRDQGGPAAEVSHVAVDRRLARLDHHLAQQDDQEQPEALGEVVRVERLLRILRRERLEVVLAPRAPRRPLVLVQQRTRLERDRGRPQHVPERLGHPDRDDEQQRRDPIRDGDPPAQQLVPAAVHPLAPARIRRAMARLTANTPTSPVEAGSIATAATPVGTLPARNSSRCGAASTPKRL